MKDTDREIYKRFGAMLIEARNERGLSQQRVADELEISKSTYGQYERGTRKTPLSQIIKLSHYYGIDTKGIIEELKTSLPVEETTYEINRKRWDLEFGFVEWTPEEIEEMKNFARYLLSKRTDKK